MARLPEPLIEARALVRLIEVRAEAIAGYARQVRSEAGTSAVQPEEWAAFTQALQILLEDLESDVGAFAAKAAHVYA